MAARADGAKLFLTEVDGAQASSAAPSLHAALSRSLQPSSPLSKDDASSSNDGVRPSERTSRFALAATAAGASKTPSSSGGGADVFRVIDSMSEKQTRSRNIRSMIQKAAQKTILVVRAKNATQAAENVTVRFHKHQVTDTPRSVQLERVCDKVLRHARFSSKKQQQQYRALFALTSDSDTTTEDASASRDVQTLLKDMFWYLTAHCFQSGKHVATEQLFYARIADTFTSLFIRLQMQPTRRDAGVLDRLPDIVAQILFIALYDAFPKSRKTMLHGSALRCKILHICHCWILGFVPADLSFAHWIAVDQESPKRIAALADFPAMRNRMLRAERIERTKLEVKNRHGASLGDTDDSANASALDHVDDASSDSGSGGALDALSGAGDTKLPHLAHTSTTHVQTRERCVYAMRNSPLVDAFLRRHQLDANATHLTVQLRLTSGTHFDLKHQEALHETRLPRGRRRRIVDPKAYTDVLSEIERFGDSVRQAYASEKKQARDRDAAEKQQLVATQRVLASQLSDLEHHSARMHEFSNLLVSKGRIDALMPATERPRGVLKPSPPPSSAPSGLAPRPPPPRHTLATRP